MLTQQPDAIAQAAHTLIATDVDLFVLRRPDLHGTPVARDQAREVRGFVAPVMLCANEIVRDLAFAEQVIQRNLQSTC